MYKQCNSSTFIICVAKNVVLAGVKSVTLWDPTPVDITDLSAQVRNYLYNNITILLIYSFLSFT